MTILDKLRHCRYGVVVLLCGFAYGCSTPKYTTVREHPEFQESKAQFKSLAVFPPDVAFQHLVFNGDHQSVPEREEAIAHELAALLPGLLAARGYEVKEFAFEEQAESDSDFAFEMSQLRDAYGRVSIELYDRALVKESESRSFDKSVGTVVNQFCARAQADGLIVTRYYGFDKSKGMRAKEIAAGIAFAALTGSYPMYPARGSAVEVAMLDCVSGDVLWTNAKSNQADNTDVLDWALADLPKI